MVEPPYPEIASLWKECKLIPFLGAGASIVKPRGEAKWDYQNPAWLPSGIDLARFLAYRCTFPATHEHERDDLGKVSSYFEEVNGRTILRARLRKTFDRTYVIGPLHKLIASITVPQLIVTTNYDTLLEEAFRAKENPFDLVVYPADQKRFPNSMMYWAHGANKPQFPDPNELPKLVDVNERTIIYKMHGSVIRNPGAPLSQTLDVQEQTEVDEERAPAQNPKQDKFGDSPASKFDNFVITEDDYVEFLSRMARKTAIPNLLHEQFSKRSFLFLGYGLNDWNTRVLLRSICKRGAVTRPSVAVDEGNGDSDHLELVHRSVRENPQPFEIEVWRARGVKIYDLPIDQFVERIREFL